MRVRIRPLINWQDIDHVLLDMDGTLLDLNYDNVVWGQRLPERYAERNQLSLDASRERLFAHMKRLRGQLDFYCLDYWADFTGVDIVDMHHEVAHLVRYRADAELFLRWLGGGTHRSPAHQHNRVSLIVTNAHPDSIAVKDRQTGLTSQVDHTVSCHQYGAPKESAVFWEALMAEHPFVPERTLLIDDNADVLSAAHDYGIAHVLSIATPNSNQPAREDARYPAFDRFDEILPVDE